MPELPEVETTVNGIKPWLVYKTIQKINVYNPSLRWPIPTDLPEKYQHKKITSISRRAKYILIHFENNTTILVHLGMSGSLVIHTKETKPIKHDHFEIIMQDGTTLRLNDPRRFGCVLDSDDVYNHKLIIKLGPEPLSGLFNGMLLKNKSKNKTQAVKNFIMNGHVVVGVGNIYACEALFLAGILPTTAAGKVTLQNYNKLAKVIKAVLTLAIKSGGTTLKDFVNADGKPGYFAQKLNVYGRTGKPCPQCGADILQKTIGQRSTFYCNQCQT